MCLFNTKEPQEIPKAVTAYSQRMSKTPLVAGLIIDQKMGTYRGATAWAIASEPSNAEGHDILLTFSKRAPAWSRVLEASSEHSVRPVFDAKGNVALHFANSGAGRPLPNWAVLALERVAKSKQRFYYGKGWLDSGPKPSSAGTNTRPKKQLLYAGLAGLLLVVLGLGIWMLTKSPHREQAPLLERKPLATSSKVKLTNAETVFNQTMALAATKTCVSQQTSKDAPKAFDLKRVIRCLVSAGYEVESSQANAIGGIAKIQIKFRDGDISIAAVVTRYGKSWRLDS